MTEEQSATRVRRAYGKDRNAPRGISGAPSNSPRVSVPRRRPLLKLASITPLKEALGHACRAAAGRPPGHATSHGTRTVDHAAQGAPRSGANETVDAEGGFLIAPGIRAPASGSARYDGWEHGLRRCFRQPMSSSNRLVINAVDEDSRVDGSRWGGIQSYYLNGEVAPTRAPSRSSGAWS